MTGRTRLHLILLWICISFSLGQVPDLEAAFQVSKVTFASGAMGVSGGSYRVGATIAETGPVGHLAGGSYDAILGFWFPGLGIPTSVPIAYPDPESPPAVRFANALQANQPNPFRDKTRITFSVADPAPVTLAVFDVNGRRACTLVDAVLPAGVHQVTWNGHDGGGVPLASGIYFIRLSVGSWSQDRSVLHLR